jgi:hypothetical protein
MEFLVKIMMFEDCPCVDEGMPHRSLLPPLPPGRQLSSTGLLFEKISIEYHTLLLSWELAHSNLRVSLFRAPT